MKQKKSTSPRELQQFQTTSPVSNFNGSLSEDLNQVHFYQKTENKKSEIENKKTEIYYPKIWRAPDKKTYEDL